MKIVYCMNTIGLSGRDAIEVAKANYLAEIAEYDVWIVYTEVVKTGQYSFSDKVHLNDLGIRYLENNRRFPGNILTIISKTRLHKTRLTKLLRTIQPDIVISCDSSERHVVPYIKGSWKTIREMHSIKNHKLLLSKTVFERFVSYLVGLFDYKWGLRKFNQVVILTQEEKEKEWKGVKNVLVIPNFVRFTPGPSSSLTSKRIVAAGRLSWEKDFSSLIRAFRMVAARHPDWRLDIYGNGSERNALLKELQNLGLEQVVSIHDTVSNIEKEFCNSSLLVSTSKYEGFGMVLVEAMACGLPVVSYDCPYGPKSIISDGKDGYLVKAGDEQALADCICTTIENPDLRIKMGHAAQISARERFSIDRIMSSWLSLFARLTENNA